MSGSARSVTEKATRAHVPQLTPIAIVGRACLLPGADSPEALAALVLEGRSAVTSVARGRWRVAHDRVVTSVERTNGDRAWSDRGGYVVSEPETPSDLAIPRAELERLDPLTRWLCTVGRSVVKDARTHASAARTGLVVGNLSFPTDHLASYAARVWLEGTPFAPAIELDPRDRFMSGLSAHLAAKALGLGGPVHALDAACASSLYAIAQAAEILARGEADAMIAGAVNRADDLFIHIGFCSLQAMSKTGRSRPFHKDADGLVPAEGCALVMLRRLDDAVRDGERILGVIRGVGLSNDGRARGLLAPSEEGQARAMRAAYASAGLSPSQIDYVECHATGTPVGDATELRSLREVLGPRAAGAAPTPLGSLKANLGHLVTVAGTAGVLKVLAAFERGQLPPTPHLDDAGATSPAVDELGFEILKQPRAWKRRDDDTPRRAAVSAFGFGGNNAHLVIEEWLDAEHAPRTSRPLPSEGRVVLVDVEARVAALPDAHAWSEALASRRSLIETRPDGAKAASAREVVLDLVGLKFPPTDLQRALAQQTQLLEVARHLAARHADVLGPARERAAVLVGMGCDAEVARWGARWRLREAATLLGLAGPGRDDAWITKAEDAIAPSLDAATVVGTMPNIPANRISSQLDLGGPSHTVSAEERSGLVALELARTALLEGRIDVALVAASDFSAEPVHERAVRALLPASLHVAGDAAVALLVMREADARAAGLPVLCALDETGAFDERASRWSVTPREGARSLATESGHAHAASGLLHVAAAAITLAADEGASSARIECSPLGGTREIVGLTRLSDHAVRTLAPVPAPQRPFRLPARPARVVLPEIPMTKPAHSSKPAATNGAHNDVMILRPAPSLPSVKTFSAPRSGAKSAPATASKASPASAAHAPARSPISSVPVSSVPVSSVPVASMPVSSMPVSSMPVSSMPVSSMPVSSVPVSSMPVALSGEVVGDPRVAGFEEAQRAIGEAHRAFLAQQVALHQQFLALRDQTLGLLWRAPLEGVASAPALPSPAAWAPPVAPMPVAPMPVAPMPVAPPAMAPAPSAPIQPIARSTAPAPVAAAPTAPPTPAVAATPAAATPTAGKRNKPPQRVGGLKPDPVVPTPRGPSFDRAQLKIHAGGAISEIFGPLFVQQDGYAVQTRMPMEPMLLADRATGLDAAPGVLGRGTTWTETDVTWQSWYLHEGRMPGGILIESGQADLFLISYMGTDFLSRGERAYRLLGCELTYHRSPPRAGETIDYDIHVDGHANQGPIRIFFFHYDCRVRPLGTGGPGSPDYQAKPLLTVRNGQAGFFTTKELDESAGILWKPEEQEIVATPRLDPPAAITDKRSFTHEDLVAFSEGRVVDCFGPAFMPTQAHVRTPRIAGGRMLFLHRVDAFEPKGGPWKRGYLKATQDIHEDDWFFPGHFHNDPCMPGTLMFEGCLQTMAFYLAAMGYTLPRDGWRFEPITDEAYKLLCRGQVTPKSRVLTYEVFVEEVVAGPIPMLYADLLCVVDGLGAFHARRMGLRLVPAWPLEERARLIAADALPPPHGAEPPSLPQSDPSKRVAVASSGPSKGFAFDYASLVACAWGRPSAAFGPIYERFDSTRKVARLPGPPYHFMSRVASVEGDMGVAKAGAKVEVEYDVPADAWYFRDNGAAVMPYSVLMEAALQPCGWLASYVGCALLTDEDLLFRNLDGKATAHVEITKDVELLRTRAHLKSLSRTGTMIIVAFDVTLHARDRRSGQETLAYSLDTVFGFFPTSAFENQAGLPISPEQKALYAAPPKDGIDLEARPAHLTTRSARLATPFLLMLDRVTHVDHEGGKNGKGAFRAEKDVDPNEWFFKAHFFQDPVQPGSLGVEAMCQLLQLAMLEKGLADEMTSPRFEAVATGAAHVWKYRGQVVPQNRTIGCTVEVLEVKKDERGVLALADASLWVDGKRIYDCKGLGMRLLDDAQHATRVEPSGGASTEPIAPRGRNETARLSPRQIREIRASAPAVIEETLDPERDRWLNDHCPTWVIPALPAMSMLARMQRAATQALGVTVSTLEGLQILRWVSFPSGPIKLRTVATPTGEGCDVALEVWREARDPRLSRFEPVATARASTAPHAEEPLAPLADAVAAPIPYETGALFHGPRFRLLESLTVGRAGARGVLRVPAEQAALQMELVLDAATHVIPHDALHSWSERLAADRAAYPYRIERAWLGAFPTEGTLEVEARLVHVDEHAHLRLVLTHGGHVCADLSLVEVLLPKGPIGMAAPRDREAFLRDGQFRAGVGLSRTQGQTTRLEVRDVALSNWLPGTVERVYATVTSDVAAEIAVKDHVAARAHVHPSHVVVDLASGREGTAKAHDDREPLTVYEVELSRDATSVTVTSDGEPGLDLAVVRRFWRSYLSTTDRPIGPWPGEDLYFALIERFMRRIRIEDPASFSKKVVGRSALYLGNHQVGIESLLFGIVIASLTRIPTLTLAKQEHRETWLGKLILHGFSYPALKDPRVIAYFDRSDPASLPRILAELGQRMAAGGQNVMIHVEGTRALSCAQPVSKMSGVFVDLALTLNAPIVPVRFVHGLPREPLEQRIEYPVGMGRQDYYVGAPIEPETLAAMPYKDRTDTVMRAINALGPGHEAEAPFESDPGFEAEVAAWANHHGIDTAHSAVALALLGYAAAHGGAMSEQGRALVEAVRGERVIGHASAEDRWLAELAARLR
jgi:3-oxoacyl-(acyl-carrier-protein) synthase/3-hydroxymyristoyl/3-hydroxydecanoyl-(acyl carrier protein) dehydratase/1-acyl-sn-glycerol-3-phosphate acyltransferase